MPLRSPKMYFCIFGFHRLVWWPKCTPASSNSFIVNGAMTPPSVCLRRATGLVCARPKARGVRDGGLRRVFGVDPHVLLAEVTGPDAVLAAAEAQVDRDLVLSASHDLANPLQAHAFPQHTVLDEPLAAEGDRDLVLLHPRGRFPQRHHDPSPVRVGPVERGLDER